MSRKMKPSEVDAFDEAHGYPPTGIRVAVDALAVYVNRDNPIKRITLPEVDAVFSKNRSCGHPRRIETWDGLGAAGDLAGRPIRLYGRNSASGTYGYFKNVALCGGDFADSVKEQPGSASVVQSVNEDPYGMGYSGIGYRTSGVRSLALARAAGEPYHGTDPESVYSGDYPLARYLYVYVDQPPSGGMDALTKEFLRFVLSRQGQRNVVKDGYLPLPARVVAEERAKLQ
jgi:phosphate transport system substrate-binding protein